MQQTAGSYIVLYNEISALPSHNLQVCGMWIVAALLTTFIAQSL
jgi:hypothetical protein